MEVPYQNAILKMDAESFERLSKYVTKEYGIKLPEAKKSMLESRLHKKVKSLGLNSYNDFLDYIFSEQGQQGDLFEVIDLITTNKTDFFREASHFQFLTTTFLPTYSNPNLKIWSAGCSTGEEPYTIIMALEEFKKKNNLTYSILASDISLRVIQSAANGIYTMDRLTTIPLEMKKSYFLRSKVNPNVTRIKPQYRNKINFKRINLMHNNFGIPKAEFDIIFCRNVLIYFDKATQEKVIKNFCTYLKPGGLLFLGHSESIMGMTLPLKQLQPTTYQLV